MPESDFVWSPSEETISQSNLKAFMDFCNVEDFDVLRTRSDADIEWFWENVFKFFNIEFDQPYRKILDVSDGPENAKWCEGGKFNIASAFMKKRNSAGAPPIIAISESGAMRNITHDALEDDIAKFAGALRSIGIAKGDRVAIYMPMISDTVVAFLAAARLGAVTTPLFSGFGADAIAERLEHSGAKVLITVDKMRRRGKEIATRETIERALSKVSHEIEIVVLGDAEAPFHDWAGLVERVKPVHEPVAVEADAPLLLVYTSGTTGAPKGAVLTHCGFAGKVLADLPLCLDLKPSDRWLWMSDFGWIIGPIMVSAAMLTGATLVLAEGAPDYPEPDRLWRIIEDQRVTFLGVAPTLIRGEMSKPDLNLGSFDLSSLRILVSSGEPWTREAWDWCFEHVCRKKAPILNWSGGTEISGGILCGTVIQPLKPLCFSSPALAMGADILDADGNPVADGEIGELVLRQPSIGLSRSLWRDHERFLESYWGDFPGIWKHGDLVSRDEDGHWCVHGRSDDVLKIGGKRTGPSEIENILIATGLVDEAAVIGLSDERAGQAIACVCVLAAGVTALDETRAKLSVAVTSSMGKPYKPKFVGFVDELPKTRSGKIVRRLIASILTGQPIGDTSSLANADSLDPLKRLATSV